MDDLHFVCVALCNLWVSQLNQAEYIMRYRMTQTEGTGCLNQFVDGHTRI